MLATYYLGHIHWPHIILVTYYLGHIICWPHIILVIYYLGHITLATYYLGHIFYYLGHINHTDTQAHASDHLDQVLLSAAHSHKIMQYSLYHEGPVNNHLKYINGQLIALFIIFF